MHCISQEKSKLGSKKSPAPPPPRPESSSRGIMGWKIGLGDRNVFFLRSRMIAFWKWDDKISNPNQLNLTIFFF